MRSFAFSRRGKNKPLLANFSKPKRLSKTRQLPDTKRGSRFTSKRSTNGLIGIFIMKPKAVLSGPAIDGVVFIRPHAVCLAGQWYRRAEPGEAETFQLEWNEKSEPLAG